MSRKVRSVRACAAGVGCAVGAVLAWGSVAHGAIPNYTLVGSFALPAGEWDIVPSGPWAGRALAMVGTQVVVQDALNAGSYSAVGSVPAGSVAAFGASFVRVSPSGTKIAFGDNTAPGAQQRVHFVSTGALSTAGTTPTTSALAFNFAGAWADDATLYVSGQLDFASRSVVTRVNADTLASTVVINNIADGSGGVAVYASRLWVGNGFDLGTPTATGNVRAFNLPALAGAGSAVGFGTGTLIADVLSASPLDFDGFGNLLAGGGEPGNASESGHAAVYDVTGGTRLNLAPAGNQFYGVRWNAVTQELWVSDPYGTGLVYRYAVPGPAVSAVALLGILASGRRRRHA